MEKKITQISAAETYAVRQPVLRSGKSVESCAFPGDLLPTTRHFGLWADNTLSAVVTVLQNNLPAFVDSAQFQIRGMAVLHGCQKHGFGTELLEFTENYIKTKGGNLVWFNARIAALGFYTKSGYLIYGDAFEIAEIGTHYRMFKKLEQP